MAELTTTQERDLVAGVFALAVAGSAEQVWVAPPKNMGYAMGLDLPLCGLLLQTNAELEAHCIVILAPTEGIISVIFGESGNEWQCTINKYKDPDGICLLGGN